MSLRRRLGKRSVGVVAFVVVSEAAEEFLGREAVSGLRIRIGIDVECGGSGLGHGMYTPTRSSV